MADQQYFQPRLCQCLANLGALDSGPKRMGSKPLAAQTTACVSSRCYGRLLSPVWTGTWQLCPLSDMLRLRDCLASLCMSANMIGRAWEPIRSQTRGHYGHPSFLTNKTTGEPSQCFPVRPNPNPIASFKIRPTASCKAVFDSPAKHVGLFGLLDLRPWYAYGHWVWRGSTEGSGGSPRCNGQSDGKGKGTRPG